MSGRRHTGGGDETGGRPDGDEREAATQADDEAPETHALADGDPGAERSTAKVRPPATESKPATGAERSTAEIRPPATDSTPATGAERSTAKVRLPATDSTPATGGPAASGTGLDAHLVVDRGRGDGRFRLDLRLSVAPGETVALLGPNGAGKTTALRALAGLEALSGGHIVLNGEALDRPGSRRGRSRAARSESQIDGPPVNNPDTGVRQSSPAGFEQRGVRWVPPEDRRIGVVFQDYLLFPHLNAIDNVAFGPRRRGLGRSEARALAADWLERVGLGEFGKRRSRQLSGGQAQRVALARALATDPALLLLDEPLAALDARTRLDTRAELHRHLAGHQGAAVLVTHDPVDALMLADRLIVIEDGRAVQEGDAESITARPRTDYIARLVGLNLYRGKASGHTVRLASGAVLTTAEPLGGAASDGEAFAAFSPIAVALYREQPDGSPRNTWRATVSGVHRHGDSVRVQLDGPLRAAADVTPAAAAQLGLEPGQTVWAAVKATEITAYPA